MESPVRLTLNIDAAGDVDVQENVELTRHLRQYLLGRDIDKVEYAPSGPLDKGAKGDPVTLTSLVVTLAPVALTGVLGILQQWVTRHERATLTLESGIDKFTLSGTPSLEQQQALEAFLDRHKS